MNRLEFIKMCGLLGIGTPLLGACTSCSNKKPLDPSDKVLIIGAGAAGLSAAYLLNQQGIQFELLEASSIYGGRMKRTNDFANFPIPTGAEWLHAKRTMLDKIVNDKSVEIKTVTTPYDPRVDYALIDGKKEKLEKLGFTIDQKFINATWFDFFEQYIVPSIKHKIRFNKVVHAIDYTNDQISVKTKNETFIADKLFISVPVNLLQNDSIQFTPALPAEKIAAIKKVRVWGGCKAFFKFSEKFYPAATGSELITESDGHKLFYDAAYGQDTEQNILGVFAVGPISKRYTNRNSEELKNYILHELDQLFDGKATPAYQKHIFQNWTDEPFARGAYVHYFEDWKNIRTLGKSVDNKLYFVGDAYTDGSNWSNVHAAAQSAKKAVEELVT